MLNETEHFHAVLAAGASRFASALDLFQAWNKDEGITERNLSLQAATAFLNIEQGATVVLEVPFPGANERRADNHLDAYFFSPRIAYLVECKQLYSLEKLLSLAQDARRLDNALYRHLSLRHKGPVPAQSHPVILADTWQPHVARWWVSGSDPACRWPRQELPAGWSYGSIQVFSTGTGSLGTLFWLYGIGPALTAPRASV
jgi:hypothetical protein